MKIRHPYTQSAYRQKANIQNGRQIDMGVTADVIMSINYYRRKGKPLFFGRSDQKNSTCQKTQTH